MFRTSLAASLLWLFVGSSLPGAERSPPEPFQTDEHTLLLYHFDEGQGPTGSRETLATRGGPEVVTLTAPLGDFTRWPRFGVEEETELITYLRDPDYFFGTKTSSSSIRSVTDYVPGEEPRITMALTHTHRTYSNV
ncbi:MAG: hypothetical protein GXY83_32300 [Rhodopirellula sp.]|nr:hypothetical protein [Rhodopirellula sp.]